MLDALHIVLIMEDALASLNRKKSDCDQSVCTWEFNQFEIKQKKLRRKKDKTTWLKQELMEAAVKRYREKVSAAAVGCRKRRMAT